jgi:hypothetical protein
MFTVHNHSQSFSNFPTVLTQMFSDLTKKKKKSRRHWTYLPRKNIPFQNSNPPSLHYRIVFTIILLKLPHSTFALTENTYINYDNLNIYYKLQDSSQTNPSSYKKINLDVSSSITLTIYTYGFLQIFSLHFWYI